MSNNLYTMDTCILAWDVKRKKSSKIDATSPSCYASLLGYKEKIIRSMSLDIVRTCKFKSFSPNPPLFINAFKT
jgi:hypothetical protein